MGIETMSVEASAIAVILPPGLLHAVVPRPHFLQAVALLHEDIFICFLSFTSQRVFERLGFEVAGEEVGGSLSLGGTGVS